MSQYETLTVDREDGLTWLTLNRPETLNALNGKMVSELRDFFWQLSEDFETRVVVLRGSGRGFCAGLDLKEQGGPPAQRGPDKGRTPHPGSLAASMYGQRRISEIVVLMRRAPQPIIAAVHGPAVGGGFAMALAADVRIAGESVRMNAQFIRLGLSACDVGVSYLLPRLIGASVASELMLTGNFIEASRAEKIGLVSRVVPDSELEAAARELAADMLRNTPAGLRLTKECLRFSVDAGSLEQAIAMEDRNQILAVRTEDFKEGVRAFLEKRPAKFRDE